MEGYGIPFGIEQYKEMASMQTKLKGKATINLNNHPYISRVFRGYHTETVDTRYTRGGGNDTDAK